MYLRRLLYVSLKRTSCVHCRETHSKQAPITDWFHGFYSIFPGNKLIQVTGTNPVTTFHRENSGDWVLEEDDGIIRSKDRMTLTPLNCSDGLPIVRTEIFTITDDGWKEMPRSPFVIKAPGSNYFTVR